MRALNDLQQGRVDMANSNGEAAVAAVNAYIDAFNQLDIDGMSAAFNFPHVRLAKGRFYTFESAWRVRRRLARTCI